MIENAAQFNYASYIHYKAFGDLLVNAKVPFPAFRKEFETKVGQELVSLLMPNAKSGSTAASKEELQKRLSLVDQLCQKLCEKGFVAATDRSELDADQLSDWADDLSDLTFNVALDGDVTMNAQILLQEQGFRFYPNYAKYMVANLLNMPKQTVTVEDYYMDTDYNSDPNLFEAKETLLNIVIESS